MKRREFLVLGAAASLVPLAGRAAPLDYTPGLVESLLAEGRVVFVDFKADWCSTCARQERVLDALKAENPAYEEAVSFVNVDWDQYGDGELSRRLNIPRRSTLVVLQGERELGRLVAATGEAEIKALMDIALTAASA